jgi:hypothetical protein
MPAYDVTVAATFQKTQATLDSEALAAAKALIESATFTVAQATANTEAAVKAWLAQQINALLASHGINIVTVTAADISLGSFNAAVAGSAGTPAGTGGSYSFTVSLTKGAASATAGNAGGITATAWTNTPPTPATYAITIVKATNGVVTADKTSATAGTTITLTITPAAGYELATVTAYRTGNPATAVALAGSGGTRTFTMPAYDVTVAATFQKTQVQLDKEAAKASIEGGMYRIAQATGNDAPAIKAWLLNTLNVLFGRTHNLQLRAATDPIIGDVMVTTVTQAVAGTEALPNGVNSSFGLKVTLKKGAPTLTTGDVPGVLVATPFASTVIKRIEVSLFDNLTLHVLNTGNVASGDLSLTLSGADASSFVLPSATISSLADGVEAFTVLTPVANLKTGTYTATLTVSGDGLTPVQVTITYTVTPTANYAINAPALTAWSQNGVLHVSGLIPGQPWSLYNINGLLIYRNIAVDNRAEVLLPEHGVYIITHINSAVKIVN